MCTLALSLGISMMGCQKSTVHPETPTLKARTLSNVESDSIVASVGNFYDYCNTISVEPTATTTLFPHSVSMEQANSLLENTFNYYFARLNPAVVEDKNDTLMLDVAPDAEGKMSISSLAQGFNSLRASLKSFQTGLGNEVKFLLADAEIVGEGNEARIRLVGTFGEPTVTEDFYPTRVNDFDSTDQWSVFNGGGKFGTTIYNGKLGSPEILTAAVNYDRTRLAPLTFFINYSGRSSNLVILL
ncbi:MAG: hypothetical protein JSS64_10070 [Bacteroidetes bacterium]|nr:hypothetical protein [Bacteroidota bacterium]